MEENHYRGRPTKSTAEMARFMEEELEKDDNFNQGAKNLGKK